MNKKHEGVLPTKIMQQFPSATAAATFGDWVANHVGLEQVLGLAGFFAPDFFEVKGHLFWDRHVGDDLTKVAESSTPFGSDAETVERYYNIVNLSELFLAAADLAVHQEDLVEAFGRVLEHFWSLALRTRFPDRVYRFELGRDLFDEEGLCLTFWQDRSAAKWQHLFVVYRIDHDSFDPHAVTIKEILTSEAEALREVERLNALNEGKRCEYSFQCAKYYPKGR